jgi:RecB family endonuclease NucS
VSLVRVVIARCSVEYTGRLSASLPPATRLLLVKADGSVLVHADGGAYRPLNWMSAPCTLQETIDGSGAVWQVTNRSGESMVVQLEEIFHDSLHELGPDPGLVKDGVERQLQLLLAEQCHVLGDGWTLIKREYPTDIGPVDLLCRDAAGGLVAVEIKRRGEIDGVEQLTRYLRRLEPMHQGITGVLAAQEFKPQAKVLAAERGIRCVKLDYDELRGMEPSIPTLF